MRLRSMKLVWSSLPGRCYSSFVQPKTKLKSDYDAVIIGGGHNGLVAAAYVALSGARVCVLERRHVIGGAAVTEEIVPGFKFSRASYLLSLFRPQIMKELELKKFGLKVYLRDPNSYTPLRDPDTATGQLRSLLLGGNAEENRRQIGQFSTKDAEAFPRYEDWLQRIVDAVQPLIDSSPVDLNKNMFEDSAENLKNLAALLKSGRDLRLDGLRDFLQLMTSPASKILDHWFESEPLKASLATDAVIGAMITPHMAGSSYVLLHHVMGELEGVKGAWGYVEGGMGAVSEAIARSATDKGAEIFVNVPVGKMIVEEGGRGGVGKEEGGGRVKGVVLEDGTEIRAKTVLSNATPEITFNRLMDERHLPKEFVAQVRSIDYVSPVTKINVALNKIPNFLADPNSSANSVEPHHRATIHLNCEESAGIDAAYRDAAVFGTPSKRPLIELVIPSSLDPTLAPSGSHVGLLFTQYTPYHRQDGRRWDDQGAREEYAETVFQCIEGYAPGFRESVVGYECLTPVDLEREFGLTGGNIFHGSLGLDQLYCQRPVAVQTGVKTPLDGLFLCGSGAHPGGGVMGAAGKLGATAASKYLNAAKSEYKRIVKIG